MDDQIIFTLLANQRKLQIANFLKLLKGLFDRAILLADRA